MFSGHYTLGQLLPLRLWVTDDKGAGTLPDTNPVAVIYDNTGNQVASFQLPCRDQNTCTGWFECAANLDSNYSPGRYTTLYTFTISGSAYGRYEQWEIVAGGDGVGSGVGMYFYRQPQADFLLLQTDRGILKTRRNPRVS
jgi:hypothetical protein